MEEEDAAVASPRLVCDFPSCVMTRLSLLCRRSGGRVCSRTSLAWSRKVVEDVVSSGSPSLGGGEGNESSGVSLVGGVVVGGEDLDRSR